MTPAKDSVHRYVLLSVFNTDLVDAVLFLELLEKVLERPDLYCLLIAENTTLRAERCLLGVQGLF